MDTNSKINAKIIFEKFNQEISSKNLIQDMAKTAEDFEAILTSKIIGPAFENLNFGLKEKTMASSVYKTWLVDTISKELANKRSFGFAEIIEGKK